MCRRRQDSTSFVPKGRPDRVAKASVAACTLPPAAWLLLALVCWPMVGEQLFAASEPQTSAQADARAPVELRVLPGGELLLRGPEARRQVVVEGIDSSGAVRDLTREVQCQVVPADVVEVQPGGVLAPLGEGTAQLLFVHSSGLRVDAQVRVEAMVHPPEIDFRQQIVPIFTRMGCNAGGCHGKSSGQNGFKLSLLGFYPEEDYEHLVKEARGRRLFPGAPQRSMLLRKAANLVPHGGGQRLEADSPEFRLLYRWIAQGMPYGPENAPQLARIEVLPDKRSMQRASEQQLVVLAWYADGHAEDVTHLAQYEPNDPDLAEVSERGLVRTLDRVGDVAVMVRYHGQVAVFRASVPLGAPVDTLPEPRTFVDRLVFERLKALGIPPSPLCDDATFLRRATIDICGRLPTAQEARDFLASTEPDKRDRLVDRLVDSPEYADYFANKWSAVLRNRRVNQAYTRGNYAFHDWIRRSLYQNKPYDQFVREILAASGEVGRNPPVAWFRAVATPEQQAEDAAQLFLGQRIGCARCHHHPFERWSQQDYFGLVAFFSRVGRKAATGEFNPADEPRIFHNRGRAAAVNPRTRQEVLPAALGGPTLEIPPQRDPRHALVDWMAQPDNPYFAPALVNRYWKHFFGRGLVDPEDDMRVTNPPSNPELLDALAAHFVASRFDLKDLVRTLCKSAVYQLASVPNEWNAGDSQNYAFFYPKRLPAEVLYDALNQLTGVPTTFNGLPPGIRAVQLPDSGATNYFLTVFGRPEAASACECERSQEANLAQSLHLLNSREVQDKLSSNAGRVAALARDKALTDEDRVRELYLWAYARQPDAEEMALVLAHLGKSEDKARALEDVVWALINTREFQFNH